ncbi:hypothetical protein C2S53_008409 [Perilla frutescens var. hirtella]|uniref:Uncharacterized protein n=1 Tax=Perilla frutescens var. hirtella TaxID=608512 RepID=A0AAD4NYL1_PERFH|nr:hypothetical protein C2S53_008409 [Perilla frutescens var. hirtella]
MPGGEEESNKNKIKATKITRIDFTSPYYLSSNDSSGNTITIVAMFVKWIMHTLDKSVKQTIPYFEEVKPLWDMLRDRFSIGNGLRIQQLKSALTKYRQSKTTYVIPLLVGDRPHGGRGSGKGCSGVSIDSFSNSRREKICEVRATGGKFAEVRATLAGNSALGGTMSSFSSSIATNKAALPGITNAQWQQLLDMLGNVNLKLNDDRLADKLSAIPTWIINSGASNHVIGSLDLLSHVTTMTECHVNNQPDVGEGAGGSVGCSGATDLVEETSGDTDRLKNGVVEMESVRKFLQ